MSEGENSPKPEGILAQTENKEKEKKFSGILTSEAANRLGRPELADKSVEFSKNEDGNGAKEVFFNGEKIGGVVSLGVDGIVEE